jgi:hypothetical protein
MYSNNFVVAIVYNNEFMDDTNGVVALPFGAEYKIRLRNKNNRRAVAKVFIDGENVTEDGIVVPANDYVDLERSTVKAVKFKFVSSKSGEAIEQGKNNKTDESNGLIKTEWKLEREYRPAPSVLYRRHLQDQIYGEREYTKGDVSHGESLCSFAPTPSRSLQEGCTVEGGYSSQSFRTTHINLDDHPATIITLKLRGYSNNVVELEQLYCGNCGTKIGKKYHFCVKCGNKLK